jgi:HlyD family secretion protein
MLTAPAVGGDALELTHLLRTGQAVKKGDVVFEFDPSEQLYKLEQNRSELLQAEQEITKAKADAAVLAAEDKVTLLKDRYGVRRAELDVQKNELVSKIDADKNDLALARQSGCWRKKEKISNRTRPQARRPLIWRRRNTTRRSWAWTRRSRTWTRCGLLRPWMDWFRSRKNMNASGGFFFTGMSLPDYHEGDQVQPGSSIAQVVDPRGLDLTSKIAEQDRAMFRRASRWRWSSTHCRARRFHGTVKSVGGMSVRQFFSGE